MLTRLKISGFKNLADVDIYFGPLTCIAGPNGAGKSNLFDAINFVSQLADKPFIEAARMIRGGDDIRSLFTDQEKGLIDLRVEMLISPDGRDDFGQPAEASATFVYYELVLMLDSQSGRADSARIRLVKEVLSYVTKADAPRHLRFPYDNAWLNSILQASARRTTFIQTESDPSKGTVVRLQADRMQRDAQSQRGGGGAAGFSADSLPRTVLSSAQNADETRTAVLVRNEMRAWRQLQLEPSALRAFDDFESATSISPSGKHVPATLVRLAGDKLERARKVYTRLANSLVSLVENVKDVRVDRDETRRSLRFMMKDLSGLELPASSLSDGTMRFVAMSVMELDPQAKGVLCLEEPENGMHPQRILSMLDLLYKIATDPTLRVGEDNPLRQVIVSTHSTIVVGSVSKDDLVFAVSRLHPLTPDRKVRGVSFLGLPGSWRHQISGHAISDGAAIAYLKGLPLTPPPERAEQSVANQYRAQLKLDLPDPNVEQ